MITRFLGSISLAGIALSALCAPALAQGGEGLKGIGTDSDPVIIERPPGDGEDEPTLERANEMFVQLRGAWATEPGVCAGADADGGSGLYLTDTLIRWEEESCSIRDIEVPNGDDGEEAVIRASCATGNGRSPRVFELEQRDEDTLALSFLAEEGEREVELKRCPEGG